MTEKLYYSQPYLFDFTANVMKAEEVDGNWRVVLDKTAFYPEGGGQPADRGLIGDLTVLDVQKEGDIVYHLLEMKPDCQEVLCSVDREFRLDYMQQHTGQHILSAVLKRVAGAETVSVHQAEEYTSIEIDHSEFSEDSIRMIEEAANAVVNGNHPVYSFLNGSIPIEKFPIRRETKFSENVRLVQMGGLGLENSEELIADADRDLQKELDPFSKDIVDLAACGGVHLQSTGQVGLIKFLRQEKIRGRLRLFWLIGKRAYEDYRIKSRITQKIGDTLSVPVDGIEEEFTRVLDSLGDLKKKNSDLLKEMAFLKAEEIQNENKTGKKVFIFEDADSGYFKQVMISLSSFQNLTLWLMNVKGEEGQWSLISTEEGTIDFNVIRKELLPLIDGKGGGKAPQWQGKIGNASGLENFSEQFEKLLS